MIYSANITTPANTLEVNSVETILEVNKGLIFMIETEFPAGCCGLVHMQIFDSNYQLFPATPGESMRGDNVLAKYDDLYLKNSAPFKFTIKTWNLDEVYDHTIQVRIGIAITEAFMSRYMPSISWDKFSESLKQAAEQQEQIKQESISKIESLLGNEIPLIPEDQ